MNSNGDVFFRSNNFHVVVHRHLAMLNATAKWSRDAVKKNRTLGTQSSR